MGGERPDVPDGVFDACAEMKRSGRRAGVTRFLQSERKGGDYGNNPKSIGRRPPAMDV